MRLASSGSTGTALSACITSSVGIWRGSVNTAHTVVHRGRSRASLTSAVTGRDSRPRRSRESGRPSEAAQQGVHPSGSQRNPGDPSSDDPPQEVPKGTTIHSDQFSSYDGLMTEGYRHYRINQVKDSSPAAVCTSTASRTSWAMPKPN